MADDSIHKINVVITALTKQFNSELDAARKKLDGLTKELGTQKDALKAHDKALESNTKNLEKHNQTLKQLDKTTKNRIDRLETSAQKARDEANAIDELIDKQNEQVEAIDESVKAYQDAEMEKDAARKRAIDRAEAESHDWEAQQEFQTEVLKREQERQDALDQEHFDRMRENAERGMAERLEVEREYNEEVAKLRKEDRADMSLDAMRANIAAKRGTASTREQVSEKQFERIGPVNPPIDESAWGRAKRSVYDFNTSIKRLNSSLDRIRSARRKTTEWAEENNTLMQRLAHSSNETSGAMRKLEWRLAKLGRTFIGLAIASVLIFMQSFASALTAVGAQAIALVGSIGAAASAIGGTLVSAIAQAIPMLGILAATMQRVSIIQDAIGQFDALQQEKADPGAQAQDAQAAKDAADQIADAQRNQQQAQEDLTEARADARRELEDLIQAEKEANLAVRDAVLTQKEARQELEDAIQEGDVGGIDRAQLAVDEARLGLEDAKIERDRAAKDLAEAQKGGIDQMDTVVNATEQLADANRALADAHESAATSALTQSAAEQNLNYFLSQLTDSEKELYFTIIEFRKRLEQEFAPITDNIIEAFTYGIKGAEKVLFDNNIMDALEDQSRAMKSSLKDLIDLVTSKQSTKFWEETIRNGTENLEPLEDILRNIFRIMRSIAEGAAPVLHRLLKLIADVTKDWADGLRGNKDQIEDFFQTGLRHLRAWGRLLMGIVDLFGALMGVSGPSAIKTLDDLTKRLHDAADGLRDNSQEARHFFNQTSKVLGYLLDIIVAIGAELVDVFEPKAVKALADILIEIVIPALGEAIEFLGQIAIILDSLPGWVKDVIKFGLAFLVIKNTLGLLVGLLAAVAAPLFNVITMFMFLKNVIPVITAILPKLATGLRLAFIGTGIGLLITAIILLLDYLGVLDDVWNWIKNAAVDAWEAIKDAAKATADWFSDNFGEEFREIASSLADLWDTVKDRWANVWDAITFIAEKVVGFFRDVFNGRGGLIGSALRRFWEYSKGVLKGLFEFIRDTIKNALRIIGGFIKIIDGILSGDFGKVWEGIKDIVGASLDQILNLLDFFTQPFEEAGKAIGSAFADTFGGAFEGIKDIVADVLDFVLGGFSTFLGGLASVFESSPEIFDVIPGFDADSIASGLRGAEETINNLRDTINPPEDETVEATEAVRNLGNEYRNTSEQAEALSKKTNKNTSALKENTNETKDNQKETKAHARGIKHLGNEYRNTTDRAQQLGEETKDNTDKTKEGTKENKAHARGIKQLGNEYRNTTDRAEQLGKETDKTKNKTKDHGDESRRTGRKVNVLAETFLGAGKQSKELAEVIRDATNKALSAFGAKELKFSVPKVSKVFSDVGSTIGGAFQTGGYFGNPSLRTKDDRFVKVAGGEAILTGHQQQSANLALEFAKSRGAIPYGSLAEMFARDKRPHSTAPPPRKGMYEMRRNYQDGGGVPGSFAKFPNFDPDKYISDREYKRLVNIAQKRKRGRFIKAFRKAYGPSAKRKAIIGIYRDWKWATDNDDEFWTREEGIPQFAKGGNVSLSGAHSTVSAFVSALIEKFGGSVGSGLRAYDSGSLHSTGQAIDYSPSDWSGASRAVNAVGPSLLEGIYNPGTFGGQPVSWDEGQHVSPSYWGSDTWAGHLDHIHIAIADGTKKLGKGVAGIMGGMVAQLKKIKIKGPEGRIKDALQGQADKLRDAANKKLGKYGTAGMDIAGRGVNIKNLPPALAQYNKVFEEHNSATGDYGGYVMPKPAIAALAEWVGTPGWTMEYITRGESGGRPGATGIDPGGTKGLGLWMITTGYNDAIIAKLGGEAQMRNPILNAIAMKSIYDSQGLGAWYAAHSPNSNDHYTGKLLERQRGGMIPQFDQGGVVPGPRGSKQLVVAHGGETFIPTHKESFAKGGQVAQAFGAIGDIMAVFVRPGAADIDIEKKNWRSKWKDEILAAVEDLLRDGGAFDDLMTAIEEQITNLATNLSLWSLKVRRGIVAQVRSTKEISEKTLKNLEKTAKSYEKASEELDEMARIIQRRIRKSKTVDERQKFRAALESIEDRQRELDALIAENMQARLDAQVALFDSVIARFEQMLSRVDSLRTIAELRAQIRGGEDAEIDPETARKLFRRTGNILRKERREIRQELRQAREAGDIDRVRELRQAMLDNKIAILENTQALKETKDQIQETFSFNTTPWQLFRQAILNGSGGLIPGLQGTIPSLASGGKVVSGGLVNLHAGEVVTSADAANQNIEINFTEPMEVADPEAISSAIAWKLKTQV
jgi:chromosome segregation ATPase